MEGDGGENQISDHKYNLTSWLIFYMVMPLMSNEMLIYYIILYIRTSIAVTYLDYLQLYAIDTRI